MKYLKLNNTQARKLTGKYDEFNAFDARFIEEDFYICSQINRLGEVFGIAKRYLNRLIDSGEIKVIDMSNKTDPDVIKLTNVFKETERQNNTRIERRVTKWDYNKIEINKEL